MQRSHIIISIISFLAGLLVYDVFIVDLYLATKEQPAEMQAIQIDCPGEQFIADSMLNWSREYDEKYPDSTIEDKITDWNTLLLAIGCDDYQVTVEDVYYSSLLSDLIYASSTDVAMCPAEDELSDIYEHWYNYFMRGSATSTEAGALEGWNDLMVRNGCLELVNPNI